MPRHVEMMVEVLADEEAFDYAAAERIAGILRNAVTERGLARMAISGGNTPRAIFKLLGDAQHALRGTIPWERLHLFWVDERCVAPDDPESNYGMTREAMLDHVPLPAVNVHRMEGELDPQEAASRYEAEIRNSFKLEGAQTPTFDLILLGMGDDGHTASLFPHTEALDEMARICIANHVPQKDTWRMTLTWPVLNQGREVVFLVEGEAKASILKTVFQGKYDPETWPSQLIRPASGKLTLLTDAPAASQLDLGEAADGVAKLVLS